MPEMSNALSLLVMSLIVIIPFALFLILLKSEKKYEIRGNNYEEELEEGGNFLIVERESHLTVGGPFSGEDGSIFIIGISAKKGTWERLPQGGYDKGKWLDVVITKEQAETLAYSISKLRIKQ